MKYKDKAENDSQINIVFDDQNENSWSLLRCFILR